ncbi:MAG TPA: methanogenesis marker 3 protein [Methanoculleus sp.]|nr:methanogenesis marker 3 protein [Methanoculleus sp.]
MIEIHLDGTRLELQEGTTLGDILPARKKKCCVAIVRPVEAELAETKNIKFYTTAGEVVVELNDAATPFLKGRDLAALFSPEEGEQGLAVGWGDRYAVSFGPFSAQFSPSRRPFRYAKGDLVVGCGGYDPRRSFLIFSRADHMADFGAAADGGVIGKVVSGRGVLGRWAPGDAVERIERVISWADQTNSFIASDDSLPLEDGMYIVSFVRAVAEGYSPDAIDTATAESVEHLLMTLEDGYFLVKRSTSTHIMDQKLIGTPVPQENKASRLEGIVTARTRGKAKGCIYIYTQDTPGSPAHTVVGRVEHGIELVKLVREGDAFCFAVEPERLDFMGMTVAEARSVAAARGVSIEIDEEDDRRVVVGQEPGTTLEVLAGSHAALTTVPADNVLAIRLDDKHAPMTCTIFRDVTGLKEHRIGFMPFLFNFEDVYLFKPKIATGRKINLENLPTEEVPAFTLAMTNDSRKSSGLVGVRVAPSTEFGPTSEPFGGTNVFGMLLEPEKLVSFKEGDTVVVREVRS